MNIFHTNPRGSLESRLDEMLYTCVQPTQGWVEYIKAEPEMTFHLPPGPLAIFLKKMVVERLTSGSWASGCDGYLLYTDHAQLWRGVQHSLKLLSDAAESGLSVNAWRHGLQQGIDARRSAILAMHRHILQE